MAQYSTGITATWNTLSFKEVQSLSWNWGGARQDRGLGTASGWTPEPGSVTLACLGLDNISSTNVGLCHGLTITGGAMTLSCKAVFESVSAQAELNGITRYNVTLKILT